MVWSFLSVAFSCWAPDSASVNRFRNHSRVNVIVNVKMISTIVTANMLSSGAFVESCRLSGAFVEFCRVLFRVEVVLLFGSLDTSNNLSEKNNQIFLAFTLLNRLITFLIRYHIKYLPQNSRITV